MGNLNSNLSCLKKKSKTKKVHKSKMNPAHSQENQEMDQQGIHESSFEIMNQDINLLETSEEIEQNMVVKEANHLCSNTLLPHLVWETLLKKLQNTDIENCSNSSLYFRSILKKDYETNVSLPKVFAILAERYSDAENLDDSYLETNLQCVPWIPPTRATNPHILTGFWKCRLVCKKWNQIIEHLYENEDAGHFELNYDLKPAPNSFMNHWVNEKFQYGDDGFSRRFDATHFGRGTTKNPFLGRSLCIKPDGWLDNEDFVSIVEVLQRYGHEIWHFDWTEPSRRENYEEDFQGLLFYLRLTTLVNLMPNLKVLRIKYFPVDNDLLELLQVVEHEINTNPFPKLANLKFVSTYKLPNAIQNHILIQNQHISQLEVRHNSYYGANEIFSVFLANVTILSLEFRSVEDFEKFENYPICMKLKKVQLHWHKSAPFMRWSRVFQALEAKISKNDCTDIFLDLPIPHNESDRKLVNVERHVYTLNFPKLERVAVFEKLPDYNSFYSEIVEASNLNLDEIDVQIYPQFVLLNKSMTNPCLVYREPLFSLKICSEFQLIGSAVLIKHQGLMTCHFEYMTRNKIAKSFSKAQLQSFKITPSNDYGPVTIREIKG